MASGEKPAVMPTAEPEDEPPAIWTIHSFSVTEVFQMDMVVKERISLADLLHRGPFVDKRTEFDPRTRSSQLVYG